MYRGTRLIYVASFWSVLTLYIILLLNNSLHLVLSSKPDLEFD